MDTQLTLLDYLHTAQRLADADHDRATRWAISYAITVYLRMSKSARDDDHARAERLVTRAVLEEK